MFLCFAYIVIMLRCSFTVCALSPLNTPAVCPVSTSRQSTNTHCTRNYEDTRYLTKKIFGKNLCQLTNVPQTCTRNSFQLSQLLSRFHLWSCHPSGWRLHHLTISNAHPTRADWSDCRIVYQTRYPSWLASRLKRFKRVSMVTKYSLVKSKERERLKLTLSTIFSHVLLLSLSFFFAFWGRCVLNIMSESWQPYWLKHLLHTFKMYIDNIHAQATLFSIHYHYCLLWLQLSQRCLHYYWYRKHICWPVGCSTWFEPIWHPVKEHNTKSLKQIQ